MDSDLLLARAGRMRMPDRLTGVPICAARPAQNHSPDQWNMRASLSWNCAPGDLSVATSVFDVPPVMQNGHIAGRLRAEPARLLHGPDYRARIACPRISDGVAP
jgi:hypothetical protein